MFVWFAGPSPLATYTDISAIANIPKRKRVFRIIELGCLFIMRVMDTNLLALQIASARREIEARKADLADHEKKLAELIASNHHIPLEDYDAGEIDPDYH